MLCHVLPGYSCCIALCCVAKVQLLYNVVSCVARVQSLYNVEDLKELFSKARFARCRARFSIPVILFEGKVGPPSVPLTANIM